MISQATKKRFEYDRSVLKEYEHWAVLFRQDQITPGSMIIIAKSGKSALGELNSIEWAEFSLVSSDVERWTKDAFGAEKYNYLALMMKDPEVHFHFVPRYSQPIVISSQSITDPDWPLATKKQVLDLSDIQLDEIQAKIRSVQ